MTAVAELATRRLAEPSTDRATSSTSTDNQTDPGNVTSRVYGRVGLLGNPSDGFHGKGISFSLQNFWAEVTLLPHASQHVSFTPHPDHDATNCDEGLEALAQRIEKNGYYGGIRLLMATCKRFHEYCRDKAISVPQKGFNLSYDTNIPRQAGLSGSSAIVCAALNCLMQYHGVEHAVSIEDRPSLVLSAEQELGITAGLQDRVIQVFGGLVYMDFNTDYMREHGYGMYQPLDASLLPPLWLMYCDNPSDSGKMHSDVKQRWLRGDAQIQQDMEAVAKCAELGREALQRHDYGALAVLMDQNFNLRRKMFGDAALGQLNLRMIKTARSVGAAAKFTGSGGAVVVYCPAGEEQEVRSKQLPVAARYLRSGSGVNIRTYSVSYCLLSHINLHIRAMVLHT
eukprot:jgi/Chrzof1/1475/Cz10g09080.t1